MRELPTGTVTFLFTDIEGSTSLLQELGEAYAEALSEHRSIVRAAVAGNGGTEVDTQGDAFFIAFPRASAAAAAAAEIQAASVAGPVKVRIGLHSGEPTVTDEGYIGLDVHRGARVMSAGHGGQVLLSERTRALLADNLQIRDLGVHRLKDLGAPERLFQLGDDAFPPLRTLNATNLPSAVTPLVGRQPELAELVTLLEQRSRIVSVTGPGGTGKTRLALQVAAELVGSFRDGVYWVPLGGIVDPTLVTGEIAQAVGANDDIVGFVRGRELLLLLDNFEHLMVASTQVSDLLSHSDGLCVLVTSRAPLRLRGEQHFPLEPLTTADAAALFVERTTAIRSNPADPATVDALCARLDRLPLAIELAAARTDLLTAEDLLKRLERALPLLTGGARDAPERQRTLRATIEWSYELLDDSARRLFEQLGVFAGSFSIVAAERVCEVELDIVTALVDASLVKVIGDGRLLLLETIREYARERLEAVVDAGAVRRRHADFYAALAEEAYVQRFVAESEWAAALELDHDNLRAALDWLSVADPPRRLELAGALGWFWISHSYLAEGSRRLASASPAEGGRAAARALVSAGGLAGRQGDVKRARKQLEEGIALWRTVGDHFELAAALDAFGWMLFFNDDNVPGLAAFEESRELYRALDERAGETRALAGVCQLLIAQGEVERTEELSHELLELALSDGDVRSEHFAQHYLADCSLMRGDYERAEERYRASLETAVQLGDVLETGFEVQGVAMSLAGKGDHVRGVMLAAAVEALFEELGVGISVPFWNGLLEQHIGGARHALGAQARIRWSEGRSLPFEEAVALARRPAAEG